MVDSFAEGSDVIARNNHNQLFSLAENGAILEYVTLTEEQSGYLDNYWDAWRELVPGFVNVEFVAPHNSHVEKRQIKIPPVLRPFANEANPIENGNSEIPAPDGRAGIPNAFNIKKRQSRNILLGNGPNAVKDDLLDVPAPEGRPGTGNINEVPPRVHPFKTPFISPTSFTGGDKKVNLTEVVIAMQDLEPLPKGLDVKPLPAGLKSLAGFDIRKGGKMSERSVNGSKDECRPLKYCVDSSGCSGGCDACTYVSWFPYGQCMSRENNVGKIVD